MISFTGAARGAGFDPSFTKLIKLNIKAYTYKVNTLN